MSSSGCSGVEDLALFTDMHVDVNFITGGNTENEDVELFPELQQARASRSQSAIVLAIV